jgi:hypothetical protein
MLDYQIKTHRLKTEYSQPHFFILNKGLNSGKPMLTPCPNCFVCLVDSSNSSDKLFWVAFALWKSKVLHRLLKGSVIPFITIGDYKDQLMSHVKTAMAKGVKFSKYVKSLQTLQKEEKQMELTMELIKTARMVFFQRFFTS